jgi:diguanylate cyclase (GGDEF)-like protein
MDREAALSKLSIRLTHLSEGDNPELSQLLKNLRQSIKGGGSELELDNFSNKLARQMMAREDKKASVSSSAMPVGDYAAEFAKSIKSLKVGKSYRSKLDNLADQMSSASQLEHQLESLKGVFQLLRSAHSEVPTKKDASAKKGSSGSVLGWFDKKGSKDSDQWQSFLSKSTQLLEHILSHIDVLTGDSSETKWLKDDLEQSSSVDAVETILEEVITLLMDISGKVNEERTTTHNFLGGLRDKLHSVEEVIFSVITDGSESMERAETLGKQVSDDVDIMGKAVEQDDLVMLKKTVESGLANLSTKVADYLAEERKYNEKNKTKVKDLTRQLRVMEVETTDLRSEVKSKQDLAVKDPLTGVYNRAGYEERVTEEFARRQRVNTPLSVVFVDCNKFKQINDTFGHTAGDVVLVKVAETLKNRARASDIVARYGGDEFVVLLPDTPLDGAEVFAQDACQKVLAAGFNNNGQPLDVSISCGVTEVRGEDDPASALHRADQAMYEAKKLTGEKVFVVK